MYLRRRAGLCLAGGGITFMVDVTACPTTPSAMCRRRPGGADRVHLRLADYEALAAI